MTAKVFVAPLRHAVIVLGRKALPWTIDAMCVLGQARESATKAYANRLSDLGILVSRPDGMYQVGQKFAAWAQLKPKTRPGGGRRQSYKAIPANAV